MKELRDKPLTLQLVADHFGITREAVRTDLKRHYGTAKITGYISRLALAKRLGCDDTKLETLERNGILNPKHIGGFYLYEPEEALKARKLIQVVCVRCGKSLPKGHWKYCEDCDRERRRYNYPFLSPEAKERYKERAKIWHRLHRKQKKAILI